MGIRGHHPAKMLELKMSCRCVLEHFRYKYQLNVVTPDFLIFAPAFEDSRDAFCISGGAIGRPWMGKLWLLVNGENAPPISLLRARSQRGSQGERCP